MSCPRRPRVRCAPAIACESRPPVEVGMAASQNVAFLGLGIMGRPQAANVRRAGFELTVWNRTRERAESFAAEHDGVAVADSPAEAARGAAVWITLAPNRPGAERGLS